MILTTTKCSQFGHPEFALEAKESCVPDVYLQQTVTIIESMVADGSVFRPGQTFQVGWMLTLVQSHDASHLTLHEPDMQTMPIRWIPGITETLRQMMMQLFMLDSVLLRAESAFPSIQDSLVVCTRYTERSFFMERLTPSEGHKSDTGWFIGCLHEDHNHNDPANLRCVSVYEAFLHQQAIEGFMAFPVGSMIVIDHEHGLAITRNRKELPITAGSFLAEWFKKQTQFGEP